MNKVTLFKSWISKVIFSQTINRFTIMTFFFLMIYKDLLCLVWEGGGTINSLLYKVSFKGIDINVTVVLFLFPLTMAWCVLLNLNCLDSADSNVFFCKKLMLSIGSNNVLLGEIFFENKTGTKVVGSRPLIIRNLLKKLQLKIEIFGFGALGPVYVKLYCFS